MTEYLIDDSEFQTPIYTPAKVQKKAFVEAEHPRNPEGSSEGGQFAPTGSVGQPTSDPTLAKQAADGIAAVEKLIPEAIKTADFRTTFTATTWDDLSSDVQDPLQQEWESSAYDDLNVDTSDLTIKARQELQGDNGTVLEDAHRNTLMQSFPLYDGKGSMKFLDPETLDYDDGTDDDGSVAIDLDKLRFTDKSELTAEAKRLVKDTWDKQYSFAFEDALQQVTESDSFQEQVHELETEAVNEQWSEMSDSEKFNLGYNYDTQTRKLSRREPDHWVTGVETGTHSDEDYGRTHALALKLTEMRTDEIRKERGLMEPEKRPAYTITDASLTHGTPTFVIYDSEGNRVGGSTTMEQATRNAEQWADSMSRRGMNTPSHELIDKVWSDWKSSSSSGLGLSLQLATAQELGGHHRMTPEEMQEATENADLVGGLPTLRAYVRAQWEVTQTVMKKAGEDHLQVYRGLMLDGDRVKETTHQPVDKMGGPVQPPTNVTPNINKVNGQPIVTFDFNGEHFVVEKERGVPAKSILDLGKPLQPSEYETDEAAVQRRIDRYLNETRTNLIFTKLPDILLQRAGAQSTTGTRSVANDWGGAGKMPENPIRVVLRVDAPATSALSLPVYGQNTIEEHETVLAGTKDHWTWDAWHDKAPDFESQPVTTPAKKEEKKPLVIDLQAEDRGKPHWLSTVDWSKVKTPIPVVQSIAPVPSFTSVLKYNPAQRRGARGTAQGGRWVKDTTLLSVDDPAKGLEPGTYPFPRYPIPAEKPLGNAPRLVGAEPPPKPPSNLATIEITDYERNQDGGVNDSAIVTLADGTQGIYKPESGELWGGGFTNHDIDSHIVNRQLSLAEREAMASEVDQALGLDLVPETVLREQTDVDLGSSGGGSGYSESELGAMYDRFREGQQDQAMEAAGEQMYSLYGKAKESRADNIQNRAEEINDIWNELIANTTQANPAYGAETAIAEHPVLPLGSQDAFQRKEVHRVIDPIEVLDEAHIDLDRPIKARYKETIVAILQRKLQQGYNEMGDVDPAVAQSHLTYGHFVEEHADTEMRLVDENIQTYQAWKQSHGYSADNGGGSSPKNAKAPHPQGGSLQRFLDGADTWGGIDEDQGSKFAVLDYVIGTMDRHGGNILWDDTASPKAIDNGYSFPGPPHTGETDTFQFRSNAVHIWKNDRFGLISDETRRHISDALAKTNWLEFVARHPNMSSQERSAFLGRVLKMQKALATSGGLKQLWESLDLRGS